MQFIPPLTTTALMALMLALTGCATSPDSADGQQTERSVTATTPLAINGVYACKGYADEENNTGNKDNSKPTTAKRSSLLLTGSKSAPDCQAVKIATSATGKIKIAVCNDDTARNAATLNMDKDYTIKSGWVRVNKSAQAGKEYTLKHAAFSLDGDGNLLAGKPDDNIVLALLFSIIKTKGEVFKFSKQAASACQD